MSFSRLFCDPPMAWRPVPVHNSPACETPSLLCVAFKVTTAVCSGEQLAWGDTAES